MPEILINGEKKKVACGPCIRGHRSSKCNHKDRVLIEVRKPGRPLSACPHPAGSCNCERVVLNYTIPKATECPCPVGTSLSPASSAPRVQKQRNRKASVTTSALQKAIKNDSSLLSQEASQPNNNGTFHNGRDDQSQLQAPGPLTTIQDANPIRPSDNGTIQSNENQATSHREPKLQLGMMGIGGPGTATDEVGWDRMWPDMDRQLVSASEPDVTASTSGCCKLKIETETSCCGPKPRPQQQHPAHPSCCNQGPQHPTSSDSGRPLVLDANALDFFSTDVAFNGFSPFHEGHAFTQPNTTGNPHGHRCHCGDGCQCLGCAMHPRNNTTMGYVLYHGGVMMGSQLEPRLPFYHLPQASPYMATNGNYQISSNYPFGLNQQLYQQPNTQGSNHTHLSDLGLTLPFNDQWPSQSISAPAQQMPYPTWSGFHLRMPSSVQRETLADQLSGPVLHPPNLQQVHSQEAEANTAFSVDGAIREDSAAATTNASRSNSHTLDIPTEAAEIFDADSLGDDESATTMSPSSYFVQQIAVPGCSEGTCLCGDGCACDGCITHSGHTQTKDELFGTGERRRKSLTIKNAADSSPELIATGRSNGLISSLGLLPTTVPG